MNREFQQFFLFLLTFLSFDPQILHPRNGERAASAGHAAVGGALRDGADPTLPAQAARAAATPPQGGVGRAGADQGGAERQQRRRRGAGAPVPPPPPSSPPPAAEGVARRADHPGGAVGRGAGGGRRGPRQRPQRQRHADAEPKRQHRRRGAAQLQGHARVDGQVAVRGRRRRPQSAAEAPLGGQNVDAESS